MFPTQGTLRVILDGPVLEVSSAAGVFAAAVEPAGQDLEVSVSAGELDVYQLA
jgi:beta-fructofuranosidase